MSSPAEFTPEATALFDALGGKLSRRHCAELAASAISPDVARLREYQTIERANVNVLRIGHHFADDQCRVPGYLLPIYDVAGKAAGAQFKPDSPRRGAKGKAIKYETAAGAHPVIDVPPTCQPDLGNPAIPLWVTEGAKKSDCAASHGLTCISLQGVWGWAGTNSDGGKTALIDWREIALNDGRPVYIAFDSDAVQKIEVQQAEEELAKYLVHKGAKVSLIRIPPGPNGEKVGLDDYLAAGGDLDALVLGAIAADGQKNVVEATLERLASLSHLDYEQARSAAAVELGIRVGALDKFVVDKREKITVASAEPEVVPATEPVDGVALLDEIVKTIEKYLVLPPHAAVAITLWIMHTWAFDAAELSPRLACTSPLPRCGKTSLLKLLTAVAARALPTSNATVAAIFRMIDKIHPTLLMDELDTYLPENDELRGILNSGHDRQSAFVLRCVGDEHEPTQFSTWSPCAVALIGKLPATLEDRSVEIKMRRRLPTEKVEHLRRKQLTAIRGALAPKCARWAADHVEALKDREPACPEALNDRQADSWEPLLAVADKVGNKWPELARKAAVALSATQGEDPSIRVRLLADLKTLFDTTGSEQVGSATICAWLADIEDAPWSGFNKGKTIEQRQLAGLLKAFSIRSTTIRPKDKDPCKGYKLADFDDAFSRYLSPDLGVTALQPNGAKDFSNFPNRYSQNGVTDENAHSGYGENDCNGATDKTARPGPEGGTAGSESVAEDAEIDRLARQDEDGGGEDDL